MDTLHSLKDESVEELATALAEGPLVRLFNRADGKPRAASGLVLVQAPPERVWECIRDMRSLQRFIEMVESLRVLPPGPSGEELVRVNLRFKIAIFSARFHFVARVAREEDSRVELTYHSGKVRDLAIRLEVAKVPGNRTILHCLVQFDIHSLGWLVNIFVRHHPEIEWGIHAGSAMSIAESVRKMAESH
jgi:ribosome-associated toxin RatA of RatAB toxin-antitoxin module